VLPKIDSTADSTRREIELIHGHAALALGGATADPRIAIAASFLMFFSRLSYCFWTFRARKFFTETGPPE
jgi:hypothetical protein